LETLSVNASMTSDLVPRSSSPITEESHEFVEDHSGSVEFDLLEGMSSLDVTTREIIFPFTESIFKRPLGSACSVSSSKTMNEMSNSSSHFKLFVDRGCTRHMFPFKSVFISYKETPHSYVILADKSKVACLGSGTVQFSLQNKSIILHDVLHVPKLISPLLSVQCFRRLNGCGFLADDTGSFPTFLKFIFPVDDSSDCTINGCLGVTRNLDFDSCLIGCSSAVSDNTRFRKKS
jgi:hypothetical protein